MSKAPLIVSHSGDTGDFWSALPFLEELKQAIRRPLVFHLHTNVAVQRAFDNHPNGNVGFIKGKSDKWMFPLIEKIQIFEDAFASDDLPAQAFDLDNFRKLPLNFYSSDLRLWYYNLVDIHLPKDFSKPRIFAQPDKTYKDKIILVKTQRYINALVDWRVLEPFKDNFIFMGLQSQHQAFQRDFFKVPFHKVCTCLEFARLLAGSRGLLSNGTGLSAIAQQMKVPRILVTPEFMKMSGKLVPGPVNTIPQGGWCQAAQTTYKLETAAKALVER